MRTSLFVSAILIGNTGIYAQTNSCSRSFRACLNRCCVGGCGPPQLFRICQEGCQNQLKRCSAQNERKEEPATGPPPAEKDGATTSSDAAEAPIEEEPPLPDDASDSAPPSNSVCRRVKVDACQKTNSCARASSNSGIYELFTGDCGERAKPGYPVYYCKEGDCGSANSGGFLFFNGYDSERRQGRWYLQDNGSCGATGSNTYHSFISIFYASAELDVDTEDTIACACSEDSSLSRKTQPLSVVCLDDEDESKSGAEEEAEDMRVVLGSSGGTARRLHATAMAALSIIFFVSL